MRAPFCFLADFLHRFANRLALKRVFSSIELFGVSDAIAFVEEDLGALFANGFEYVDHILEETDMIDGQLELKIAEMTRTGVPSFTTRLAPLSFILLAYAESLIENSTLDSHECATFILTVPLALINQNTSLLHLLAGE